MLRISDTSSRQPCASIRNFLKDHLYFKIEKAQAVYTSAPDLFALYDIGIQNFTIKEEYAQIPYHNSIYDEINTMITASPSLLEKNWKHCPAIPYRSQK